MTSPIIISSGSSSPIRQLNPNPHNSPNTIWDCNNDKNKPFRKRFKRSDALHTSSIMTDASYHIQQEADNNIRSCENSPQIVENTPMNRPQNTDYTFSEHLTTARYIPQQTPMLPTV